MSRISIGPCFYTFPELKCYQLKCYHRNIWKGKNCYSELNTDGKWRIWRVKEKEQAKDYSKFKQFLKKKKVGIQ